MLIEIEINQGTGTNKSWNNVNQTKELVDSKNQDYSEISLELIKTLKGMILY